MKEYVDLSKYEFCELETMYNDDKEVNRYYITWLNRKNNIDISIVPVVAITTAGYIEFAHIPKETIDPASIPDDISVEKYMPEMEKKIEEMFGEKLIAQGEVYSAYINEYKGSPCLCVCLTPTVKEFENMPPCKTYVDFVIVLP